MTSFSSFTSATKLAITAAACTLVRIQGYYAGTADAWLQLFDSAGEPANGTVPKKSFALSYNSPYSWAFEIDSPIFNIGCYVAVSSTAGTYTPVAFVTDTVYCDFQGEYVSLGVPLPTGLTLVGDSTTGRDGLQLWSTPVGFLYTLNYTNLTAGTRYLMLFPKLLANLSDGDEPQLVWAVAAGSQLNLVFDQMFLFSTNKGTDVPRSVYVSTTPIVLTKNTSLEGYIWAYIKV